MRLLLFLGRIALICNMLFLLCLLVQRTHDFIHNQTISAYVVTMGWFVSPVLNITVGSWWLFARLNHKAGLPVWLGVANLFFLLLQFFVYFIV